MTGRAAVLGHPIGHSKSPALHRAAYAALGVDIGYEAIDVTVDALPGFLSTVRAEDSWRGLSVTMPLKAAIAAAVDEVRGVGEALGVVNTVAFEPGPAGPRLVGYNTDVAGIVNALRYAGAPDAPSAAVLGGGGTAAAAVAALRDLGTSSATVFVRDAVRAADVRAAAAAVGIDLQFRPLTAAARELPGYDVVVSTLPPRAADGTGADLAAAGAATPGILLDAAYDPWPSRIAAAWTAGGGTVVPGLEMLLYQAIEQVRLFAAVDGPMPAEVIDVMCDAVGAPRRVF
ncbi:shikimate dehydrogenase [Arthrobacter sp. YD4]|uniref:shikimate dehydrogenase n=1 Tax=Arthrobacter sp. YD4 TaxID=3058043 RepID=UPI0025B3B2ED|nr:shikimate dehydrogenase [Arthrobacter sp. YD4]MDN3936740.1 shikimate dehydrogenase [Arthrobacter sp. YD4]